MPLGKYYCDYCDKQFQDTPSARWRHLQGLQHQRAKSLWYNSVRDDNPHLHPDSFGKGVCNRFVRTGTCQYGDSCIYFHPKQNLQSVNPPVTQEQVVVRDYVAQVLVVTSAELAAAGGTLRNNMGISWGNLPPSLKPPPEGGYPPLPFIDWG